MSGRALYRVVVRMLYDPDLARAVYADRDGALAGEDLTAEERSWLVAPDPRAYRTDAARRARTLAALMEELSTAAAMALRRGREGARPPETKLLEAFFASRFFHDAIRGGAAMIFAFADYVEFGPPGQVDARVGPLARLDKAIAAVRRAPAPPAGEPRPRPGDSTHLVLAPWARVLAVPAGTSELHHRVRRALTARGRTAIESLLDPRWSLPVLLGLDPDAEEHLVVDKVPEPGMSWADATPRYAPVTLELYSLLRSAETRIAEPALAARMRELGAEPGEEAAVLGNLVTEGLLCPAAP